ncbi:MAG: hypothetical protein R3B06_22950 [Kofleriaceae bacterium]
MRVADRLTEEEEHQLQQAERVEGTQAKEREEEAEVAHELPHAVARYAEVVAAVTAMLDHRTVDLDQLTALTAEERDALEVMPEIVSGRRGQRSVLAEVRLERLNQVLATLQPVLAVATMQGTERLGASFEQMREQLNELRHQLTVQEESEENRLLLEQMIKAKKPDDDDDDGTDDDDDDAPADDDAEAPVGAEPAPAAAAQAPTAAATPGGDDDAGAPG